MSAFFIGDDDFTGEVTPSLPTRARIVDQLADLMFCADSILEVIGNDPLGYQFEACEAAVRSIYDATNALMKSMCD